MSISSFVFQILWTLPQDMLHASNLGNSGLLPQILGRPSNFLLEIKEVGTTWMTQLVKHPTSTQIMILQSVSSSPTSGSVLTAQNLEPALNSVSPSLSSLSPHSCSVSLCLSKTNKLKKKIKQLDSLPYSSPTTGARKRERPYLPGFDVNSSFTIHETCWA